MIKITRITVHLLIYEQCVVYLFKGRMKNGTRTKHLPGQNITTDKIPTFTNPDKITTPKYPDKTYTWQKHLP